MYIKNQFLRDTDIFGMAHFLDKDLVDYILKIELKEKFGDFNKQLLV